MKRILFIFSFLLIGVITFGQSETWNKGGVKVGAKNDADLATIKKITLIGNYLYFWNGATNYSPGVAAADRETGIALVDSTGNASGNYMTRQNYHNDPTNSSILKNVIGFGSTIKALPIGSLEWYNGATLADGTVYYQLHYIAEPTTLTGAAFVLNTQGNITGDNFNGVALYKCDAAGTTHTRVSISANDEAIFEGTVNTLVQVAFTGTYLAAPGYYYSAVLMNYSATSTTPKIYSTVSTLSIFINGSLPSSKKVSATNAGETAFPDTETAAGMGAFGYILGVILY
jgi:hypothetical protein